ncbi:MAG: MmgE/PrpD family protein [Novosphingobium sp.]
MTESASRQVARFAASLRLDEVPAPVRTRARLHILDALGAGLASNAQDYAEKCAAGVRALGSPGDCSVVGREERLELRDAALLNGILIHGLDFDDTHLESIIHPTATSLPVALSLGEALDASGADLLTAFLAGVETSIRTGGAARGGFHHVGYHATGVISHFASALTAGKLLGLDENQITAAQGIAGSTAAGIQVFLEEGAWTKRFHPGWGAVAGITAARLAQNGFKGPSRVYEGKFGLFDTHLHGAEADIGYIVGGLGSEWKFGDTALKPYPVCHFIHGCADAAIGLHGEIDWRDIVSVKAQLPEPTLHIIAEPAEAKENAETEYEAKFSAQHVVAACLIRGGFNLPDLLPDALADERVRDLAKRVKCSPDSWTRFPEFFSGGVELTMKDGRVLHRHVPVNSGAGERAMDEAAVVAKFMASASLAVSEDQAREIAQAVLALEQCPARDLMALLRSR